MTDAPWWFRFLWKQIDRGYGYTAHKGVDEKSYRYAFGCGYETFLQVVGRRRGWVKLPKVARGIPAWLEGLYQFALTARGARQEDRV